MTCRIGRVSVVASDLDRSATFYREAFAWQTLYDGDLDGYRLLHVGPGPLADGGVWLHPSATPTAPGAGGATHPPLLVLYLDDAAELDEVLARLGRLGVTPHVGPLTDPSGDRYAHVRDPDGHELVLAVPGPRRGD